MTKIKLVTGEIINCISVELVNGILKLTIKDGTTEGLATLFSDKSKTSHIILLTESGKESGYKTGFTSFAGITYQPDGTKTVELFQPADVTEARISSAEGRAHEASNKADMVKEETQAAIEQVVTEVTLAMASILEAPVEEPAENSETTAPAETAPEEEVSANV